MSKCDRCEGVGRVQVEVMKGVLVVKPCPVCNKLATKINERTNKYVKEFSEKRETE